MDLIICSDASEDSTTGCVSALQWIMEIAIQLGYSRHMVQKGLWIFDGVWVSLSWILQLRTPQWFQWLLPCLTALPSWCCTDLQCLISHINASIQRDSGVFGLILCFLSLGPAPILLSWADKKTDFASAEHVQLVIIHVGLSLIWTNSAKSAKTNYFKVFDLALTISHEKAWQAPTWAAQLPDQREWPFLREKWWSCGGGGSFIHKQMIKVRKVHA